MDRTASLKKLPRRKQGPIALEQRVVFDADVPVAIDPLIEVPVEPMAQPTAEALNPTNATTSDSGADIGTDASNDVANSQDSTIVSSESVTNQEKNTSTIDSAERSLIPGTLAPTGLTSKEIIFIDAIVADIQQYLTEHADADVVLLDQNADALAQIAAVLNGRTGIESVHILSHGNTGELQAGNSVINLSALQSGKYDTALETIKSALSEDADILIYGCNVAQGETGQAFVQALADATGADIAASTDNTGASTLGGNWNLETSTELITTKTLNATDWAGLLAPPVATVPATQTMVEDGVLTFSTANGNAITVSDTDNPATLTVTIWAQNGSLTLSRTTGLTFSATNANSNPITVISDGTADNSMSFTGSIANINAALNGMTFRPAENYNSNAASVGTNRGASITLRVNDATLSNTNTVNINVTAVNDSVADTITIQEDATVAVTTTPITNDNFGTSAKFITAISQPSNGTATSNTTYPGGVTTTTVGYVPNANFNGADAFTYTVTTVDKGFNYEYWSAVPTGDSGVYAQLLPGGFPTTTPNGTGWTAGITPDDGLRIQMQQNDTDTALIARWSGVFLVEQGGNYTFNLVADNSARLIIDGQVVMTDGWETVAAAVTVNGLTAGIHTFQIQYIDVNINEGISLTYSGADTSNAAVNINNSARWGSAARTETQTVNVTVNPVNDAPVAVADVNLGTEDNPITGNVLTNDTDIDVGDSKSITTFTIVGVTGTFNAGQTATITGVGSFSLSNTGTYTFTPALNYNGALPTINYTMRDSGNATSTSTLSLSVSAVNDAPVAMADTNAGLEDTTITGSVRGNDSDVDNASNTLTVSGAVAGSGAVTQGTGVATVLNGTYGQLTLNADGTYSYVANNANALIAGQTATDTFTYTLTDPSGAVSNTATLVLTITGTNDAAIISGTTTGSIVEASGVANAVTGTPSATGNLTSIDVDGTNNSFTAVSTATASVNGYGSYTMTAAGIWAYTVNNNNAAVQALNVGNTLTDTFTITAADGTAQVVTITINGANDTAVIAGTGSANLTESNVAQSTSGTLSVTDVDNSNTFTAQSSVAGSNGYGVFSINAAGAWTYAMNTAHNAFAQGTTYTDSITVAAADGTTQVITVSILGTNDAPTVATPITAQSVNEDSALNFTVPATTFSEVDNGDSLTLSATLADGSALPAWLSFNAATRTFSGTPANTDVGSLNIRVTATDSFGASVSNTFALTVNNTNDAPIANADSNSGLEDNAIAGNVLTNDTDVDLGDTQAITTFSISGVAGSFNAGDVATIVGVGSFTLSNTGAYTFTPVANYNGTVPTITYTMQDNAGATATATLSLTVTAVNDAPTVSNASTSGTEDASISGSVAGNDVDGNALTYSLVGVAPAGVVFNADGTFSVTPLAADQALDAGESRVVTFQYIANDGTVNSAPATITVTINGVNDAPTVNNANLSGTEDAAISGSVSGNDVDVEALTYSLVGAAPAGVVFNADGTFSVTPLAADQALNVGQSRTVTFQYVANDGSVDSTPATVTVVINGVNDAPVSTPDAQIVPINGSVSGNVLSNDSDVDNPVLSVQGFTIAGQAGPFVLGTPYTIPGVGEFTMAGNGSYTFTPVPNFNGSIPAISFVITDGSATDNSGALSLTMSSNTPPVAVDDSQAVTEDTPVSGNLLSNDSDINGNPLTVTAATIDTNGDGSADALTLGATTTLVNALGATIGTITVNADGSYSFNPASNYNGSVPTLTYTVNDGLSGNDTGTLTLGPVSAVNDAPVAVADTNAGLEDATITGSVRSNDSDVDNASNTLTVSGAVAGSGAVTQGAGVATVLNGTYGQLTLNADGTYSYVANNANALIAGQTATDTFTYTLRDPSGAVSNTATLVLTITGTNDAAIISGTTTGSIVEASGVANAVTGTPSATGNLTSIDVDGTNNSFTAVSTATASVNGYGSYTMTAAGIWAYTVNNNNAAVQALNVGNTLTDTFTITAADGTAQVVTITINGANDTAVIAGTGSANLTESNVAQSTSGTLSVTDVDNSNTFTAQSSVAGSNGYGVFSINAAGAWTYAMNTAHNAFAQGTTYTDSITVAAADGTTQVITVSILGTNDAPTVATPITAQSVNEDSALNFTVPATTFSEVDNGDSLTLSATLADGSALPAWLSFNAATRTFSGTPANTDVGSLNIRVTATDSFGASVSNTFALTVNNTNDAPIANADSNSGLEDNAIAGNVLTNDTDVDLGDTQAITTFSISGVAGSFNAGDVATIVGVGSFTLSNTGAYTFTPVANYNGTVPTITYTMQDNAGATATATLSLTVTAVNDAPVAIDNTYNILEDSPTIVLNPLLGDSDADGNSLAIQSINGVNITSGVAQSITLAGGVINISATGNMSFTPNANFNGNITVPYVITDGQVTASANQYINVIAVNDAPVANADTQTANEDSPISGNVLTNDSDVESNTLSVSQFTISGVSGVFAAGQTVTIPGAGNITINANGSYTFNPNANYNGTVPTITYTMSDGLSFVSSTLSLSLNAVNDVPVANDTSVSTAEDVNVTIALSATDLDGSIASYTITALPSASEGQLQLFNGTPVLAGQILTPAQVSSLVFVPANNFNGIVNIPFTATDNQGATSNPAQIVIDVGFNNDAPIANPVSMTGNEDSYITGITLTGSDTDGSISGITIGSLPSPAMGALYLADGITPVVAGVVLTPAQASNMIFKPAANFNGSISIPFTVTDDLGAISNAANISLNVLSVNDAPVAITNSINAIEDTAITISLTGSDVDNNLQSIRITALPNISEGRIYFADGVTAVNLNDTLSLAAAANLIFVPALDYNGTTQIGFVAVDQLNAVSTPATYTIDVANVNDAPEIAPQTINTNEDQTVNVNLTANTSDVDGVVASITVVNLPTPAQGVLYLADGVTPVIANQVLTVLQAQQLIFTPAAQFNGNVSIQYQAIDDLGEVSATGTLNINVDVVNDTPFANIDISNTLEDQVNTGNVIANDTDIEGDHLSLTVYTVQGLVGTFNAGQTVTIPNVGSLLMNSDGSYSFNPAANFNGVVPTVTYTITDGNSIANSSLNLSVTAVNDAPTGLPTTITVDEDNSINVSLQANDVDGSIVTLGVTALPSPATGVLQLSDGTPVVAGQALTPAQAATLVFVPAPNFNGVVNIPFTATDNSGAISAAANTQIQVNAINDAPSAIVTSVSAEENSTINNIQLIGSDIDGTITSVSLTSIPSANQGTLYLANGSIVSAGQLLSPAQAANLRFVPAKNFAGTIALQFIVTDNQGLSSVPQTFNITMTEKADDDILFEQLVSQPTPLLAPLTPSNNEAPAQITINPSLGFSNGFNPAVYLSGVMTDLQTSALTQVSSGDSENLDSQLLAYLNKAGNGTFNEQDRTYVQQAVRQQPIDTDNAAHVQNAVRQSQAEASVKQATPLSVSAQAIASLFSQFNHVPTESDGAANGLQSNQPNTRDSFPDSFPETFENRWQPAPDLNEIGDGDGLEHPNTAKEKRLSPESAPTEFADKVYENMASKLLDSSKSAPTAANSFNEQLKQARLKAKLVTTNSQITSV